MSKKPEIALGVRRVPGGWVVVEYKIANGKILSEKLTQPDNRGINLERLQQMMAVFWDVNE